MTDQSNEEYVGDDQRAIAEEWLTKNPNWILILFTVGAAAGTVFTGWADVYAVFQLMSQLFTDVLGRFTGTWFGLMAVSVGTLLCYIAIEVLLEKNARRMATIVYISIVAFLAAVIVKSDSVFFQGSGDGVLLSFSFVLGVIGQAVFYTVPGLLFIVSSIRLRWCISQWQKRSMALRYITLVDTSTTQDNVVDALISQSKFLEQLENQTKIVTAVEQTHRAHCLASAQDKAQRLTALTRDIAASLSAKKRAQDELHALSSFIKDLTGKATNGQDRINMATLLCTGWLMLLGGSSYAEETTAETLGNAPTCAVLVDISNTSPVLENRFMDATLPIVISKFHALPIASTIVIFSVGDPALPPYLWRWRILAKRTAEGGPRKEIVQKAKDVLYGFAKEIKGKEHKKSHLIGGLQDAAAMLNPKSQNNFLAMISDFREVSSLANCEHTKCSLPRPLFKFPRGTEFAGWGFGASMSNEGTKAQLWSEWKTFLEAAGARKIALARF